jgi:EAL domain-containing protein (putative c-di-GMP-specific phosphodiesterase class I)
LGFLTPDRFTQLAEDGGFMGEIDVWVFQEVCRCITRWQATFQNGYPLAVSVNLSCTHAQLLDVIPELRRILSSTALNGGCIGLEITESALAGAEPGLVRQLSDLTVLGVQLSLDDFGTGQSSLSRLPQLPMDVIKIDDSFITGLDAGTGEIVRAMVSLAHGLGMKVVAEGIESQAQLARLRDYGCDMGQGFLFSKPLTEAQATQLLHDHRVADNTISPAVTEFESVF